MTLECNTKAPRQRGFQRGSYDHENYDPRDRRNYSRTTMMI